VSTDFDSISHNFKEFFFSFFFLEFHWAFDRLRPARRAHSHRCLKLFYRAHASMSWLIFVGAANQDINVVLPSATLAHGTSNIASTQRAWGGVARNMAEIAQRTLTAMATSKRSRKVALISAVGNDSCGTALLDDLHDIGVDLSRCIRVDNESTATYISVSCSSSSSSTATATTSTDSALASFDSKWLFGFADCQIVERNLNVDTVIDGIDALLADNDDDSNQIATICFDGNLSSTTICGVVRRLRQRDDADRFVLWFEPTSREKAARARDVLALLDYVTPSADEVEPLGGGADLAALAARVRRAVIETRGEHGVFVHRRQRESLHIDARRVDVVRNVSGAGDCLVGASIAHGGVDDAIEQALELGVSIAAQCVAFAGTVPHTIQIP
jgi:sugar/nucleoside kinase (ribokinase family)